MPDKRFTEDFMAKWQKSSDVEEETFPCPICATVIPFSSESCPSCGAVFAEDEEVFECPVCGSDVGEHDTKCPKCGALFSDEGEDAVDQEETTIILDELEELLGIEKEEPETPTV
ncbi:MAG: hypothetical protein QCI38_07785, partial [Candidatus Thermoplasmatota archaeon]|nr:hypothetical protein [Candidatus Thermoplasmatota archaeon]